MARHRGVYNNNPNITEPTATDNKKAQRYQERVERLGDTAVGYIEEIQEDLEDMLGDVMDKVKEMEELAPILEDPDPNGIGDILDQIKDLREEVAESLTEAQEKFKQIDGMLDDDYDKWIEDNMEALEKRVDIFFDHFEDQLGEVDKKLSDPEGPGSDGPSKSGRPPLGGTHTDSLLKSVKEYGAKIIPIMLALNAIKNITESIDRKIEDTRDATRDLAIAFGESYDEAAQQYSDLTDTVKEGYKSQIKASDVVKVLADYGNTYTYKMSDELAATTAILENNTETSTSQWEKWIKAQRALGTTETEILEKMQYLNALDQIGADVSDILNSQLNYEDYVSGDQAEQFALLEEYMRQQGVSNAEINDILTALAKGDVEALSDTSAIFSGTGFAQLVQMMQTGNYDAEEILSVIQSMYTNLEGIIGDNQLVANALGMYNAGEKANALANGDFSAFVDQDGNLKVAGISETMEMVNNIDNTLQPMASKLAQLYEDHPAVAAIKDIGDTLGLSIGDIATTLTNYLLMKGAVSGATNAATNAATSAATTTAAETAGGVVAGSAGLAAAGAVSAAALAAGAIYTGYLAAKDLSSKSSWNDFTDVYTGYDDADYSFMKAMKSLEEGKNPNPRYVANHPEYFDEDSDGNVVLTDTGESLYNSITNDYNTWMNSEVDGSHKSGLDSVPYDGYVAELHQGERVLTAQEANASDDLLEEFKVYVKEFTSAVQYLGGKLDKIQLNVTAVEDDTRVSSTSRVR